MTFSGDHLEVSIRPSKWHCGLLAVVHLLALVALGWAGFALPVMLLVGLAVLASLGYTLWRFGLLRDSRSVIRLVWHSGTWQLVLGTGTILPVDLDATTVVLGWLVVANFRDATGRRYAVALLPDSASPDQLRRLRVLLKWGNFGSE